MDQKLKARFKAPIHQIIDEVCLEKDRKGKIAILQKYSSTTLKNYLAYLFDPNNQFSCLPEGPAPFIGGVHPDQQENDDDRFAFHMQLLPSAMDAEFVFYLTDRGRGNMSVLAVQSQFERLYRAVHHKDRPYLIAMKDKKPPTGLTRKVIAEAFPTLEAKWAPEPEEPGKKKRGRPPGSSKKEAA